MQQQKYRHTHISNNELVFLFVASWDEKKVRPLSLLNTVAYNVYWNVCNYNTQYPQAPNVAAINLARLLTELLFFSATGECAITWSTFCMTMLLVILDL